MRGLVVSVEGHSRQRRELRHKADRVLEDCRVDLPVEGVMAERSTIVVISALTCVKGEIAFPDYA
jgi:hypothetical protein